MRGLSFVGAVLAILPFVSAQEQISLQDSQVSLLLILPAVIIGLLVLVLVVATFKQRMTAVLLRFMSFKRIFTRPKQVSEVKVESGKAAQGISREAYADYMARLKDLEGMMASASTGESFQKLSFIVKDFFSNLVGRDNTYTDEEISQQLADKRKMLLEFSERVSQLKYSEAKVTNDVVVGLINEFKGIVSTQIRRHGPEKISASKNLMARIFEEDRKIFGSVKQYVEFLRREDKKEHINELLANEQRVLKRNITKAKGVYNDILKLYCQLSPDERKKVYHKLLNFYNNVNNMVFSSLYSEKSKRELAYFSGELKRIRDASDSRSLMSRLVGIPAKLPKIGREEGIAHKAEVAPVVEPAKNPSDFVEIKLRVPKLRVLRSDARDLKLSGFKFWKRRDSSLPEFKVPKVSSVKKKTAVPAPVLESKPSVLGSFKAVFSRLIRPVPHLELKRPAEVSPAPVKEGKPSVLLPKVRSAKPEIPVVEIPESLGIKKEKPTVHVSGKGKPVLESARPSFFSFGKREAKVVEKPKVVAPVVPLPEIKQPVKVKQPSRDALSDVHLRELENIKTVVKEQPAHRAKPAKFADEERMILEKIDNLIESAQPVEHASLFGRINDLLAKAESELASGDCLRAEVTYESIKPVYVNLSEDEKQLIYLKLFDFSRRLKAALDAYRAVKPVKVKQDAALLKEEQDLIGKLEALKNAIS